MLDRRTVVLYDSSLPLYASCSPLQPRVSQAPELTPEFNPADSFLIDGNHSTQPARRNSDSASNSPWEYGMCFQSKIPKAECVVVLREACKDAIPAKSEIYKQGIVPRRCGCSSCA